MTGKGSERRPQFVSDAQLEENWARTFGRGTRRLTREAIDACTPREGAFLDFARKAVGPFGAEGLARDLSETFPGPSDEHDCFGQPANPR